VCSFHRAVVRSGWGLTPGTGNEWRVCTLRAWYGVTGTGRSRRKDVRAGKAETLLLE